MKIVQLIRDFETGGAERFVIDLSNRLYKDGHDVTIIRFFDDKELNILESEIDQGIKIVTIHKKPGFDFLLIKKVFNYLKETKADVVHTHLNSFNYCFLSFLFSRKTNYFHTIHSLPKNEAINRVDLNIKKLVFKSKLVNPISISEEVHKESLAIYGQNVKLIYNGRIAPKKTEQYSEINALIEKIASPKKLPVMVNIGSFKQAKNQKMLIEIINEINVDEPKIKLLILGNPTSGDKFTQMTQLANLEHIHFLGMVNNPTDYMFASDFFCLSSLWEGMPISLIEAFATHCLAISTPAGGVKSMIEDQINGLISTEFDKESLKTKILEAIALSTKNKETIANNAYNDFVEKYSIAQCAQKYTAYYKQKCAH